MITFEVITTCLFCDFLDTTSGECRIPAVLRGAWFSWENGKNTLTEMDEDTISRKGTCVDILKEFSTNYTIVFQNTDNCYYCVKFIVRTVNVLEKIESEIFFVDTTMFL